MNCPICGGTMIGDGYTTPIHCENVELDPWIEADFGPIYCIEELPEMSDEEYAEFLEANIPLSPSGADIVYGGSDDIPF